MQRYGRDYGRFRGAADALDRQLREERAFQQERAAPGEDLGWGEGPVRPGLPGRHRQPGTRVAADLMTEDPEVVTSDTSLAEAARKMRELDVGVLPVVDDLATRRLRGVITDRDIAVRAIAGGKDGTARVGDCMTREVRACHPDARLREVLHVMERERVRRVPVVDHAGTLVGIIAQADLAVECAGGEEQRRLRLHAALERISMPARPRRGVARGGRWIH